MKKLNNPGNINAILVKGRGIIALAANQQFQVIYKPDLPIITNLKKIEIWETRNDLLYKVIGFTAKTVLMTFTQTN
jgi:hypothetical protein